MRGKDQVLSTPTLIAAGTAAEPVLLATASSPFRARTLSMAASREHRLLLCGDSAGGVFVLHLPDAVTAGQLSNSEATSADIVISAEGEL